MFVFKKQKQGNRKVKPVRNLKEQAAKQNTKPFIVATLVCMLMVSIVFTYDRYHDQVLFPITDVVIAGDIKNVTKVELKAYVLNNLQQGFFNIDLNTIAQNIESINWVAQATLRRVWPNKVEILIREHQAVAVWDEHTLLSANGLLFDVKSVDGYQKFARIHGQHDQAKELLLAYSQLEQLISKHGLHIKYLNSVKTGEMKVHFNTALNSIFALEDKDLQFKRFSALLNAGHLKLNTQQNTLNDKALKSIDLRYSNGFSVVWQEAKLNLLNNRHSKQSFFKLVNGKQHV